VSSKTHGNRGYSTPEKIKTERWNKPSGDRLSGSSHLWPMALESFMVDRSTPPTRPPLSTASLMMRLAGIAVVVAAVAGAFAYVNGTLTHNA
jgi:hypothetical protein